MKCLEKACGKLYPADRENHPAEFDFDLNPPLVSKKQVNGCVLLMALPVAVFVVVVLLGPRSEPRSIEDIQRSHLEQKVAEDLLREKAARERALQETLERIRQGR